MSVNLLPSLLNGLPDDFNEAEVDTFRRGVDIPAILDILQRYTPLVPSNTLRLLPGSEQRELDVAAVQTLASEFNINAIEDTRYPLVGFSTLRHEDLVFSELDDYTLRAHPCDRNGKQVPIEILSGQHRYHAHNIWLLGKFIGFTTAHNNYPLNAAEELTRLAPAYIPKETWLTSLLPFWFKEFASVELIKRIVGFCNIFPVRRTMHPVTSLAAAKYAFDILCGCFQGNELDAETLFSLTKCGERDMYNIAKEEGWKNLWLSAHRSGDLAREINMLLQSGVLDSFGPYHLSNFFTLFNAFVIGTEYVGCHIIRRVLIVSFPLENGTTTADIHAYFKALYPTRNLPMDWQREQTDKKYESLGCSRPSLKLLEINGVPPKPYSGQDVIRSDFRFFLTERSMREKGDSLPAGVLYEVGSTFRAIYSMLAIIMMGPIKAMLLLQVAGGSRRKPNIRNAADLKRYAAINMRAEIESVCPGVNDLVRRIDDLGDRLMLSTIGFPTLAFDLPGLLDSSAKFTTKNAADWSKENMISLADWIVCDLFTDENWLQLGRELGCVKGTHDDEKILFSWIDRLYNYAPDDVQNYRKMAAEKAQSALRAKMTEPHRQEAKELRDMADKVKEQANAKKIEAAKLLARVKQVTIETLDTDLRSEAKEAVVAKINKDVQKSANKVDELKKLLAAAQEDLTEKIERRENPADIVAQKEKDLVVEKQEELKVQYKNTQAEFKKLCSQLKQLETKRRTALSMADREAQKLPSASQRGPVTIDLTLDDDEVDATHHRAHCALLERMSTTILQVAPRDALGHVRAAYQQLARDFGILGDSDMEGKTSDEEDKPYKHTRNPRLFSGSTTINTRSNGNQGRLQKRKDRSLSDEDTESDQTNLVRKTRHTLKRKKHPAADEEGGQPTPKRKPPQVNPSSVKKKQHNPQNKNGSMAIRAVEVGSMNDERHEGSGDMDDGDNDNNPNGGDSGSVALAHAISLAHGATDNQVDDSNGISRSEPV